MKKLFSVDELASLLKTSKPVIYAMRREGSLPQGFKLGRKIYWQSKDVQAYLDRINGGRVVALSDIIDATLPTTGEA